MSNPAFEEVSIKDVAAKAGVSIASVSLALNGKGRISEKTRARIKQVADELGYISNREAAAFRSGRAKTLGYVIQSNKNPASQAVWQTQISQILFDIVSTSVKRGYAVVVIPSGDAKSLKQLNISGVIMSDSVKNDPDYKAAVNLGIPVGTNERSDLKELSVNWNVGYKEMTEAALDLLVKRGSKYPALLTEPDDLYSNYKSELAYLNWCKRNQIAPLVARGKYDRSDLVEQVNKLVDGGADAIYSFYEEGPGVLAVLKKRGLKVPQDILLIAASSYDDNENKIAGVSTTVYHYDVGLEDFTNSMIDVIEGIKEPGIQINTPWELNEYRSTKR